MDQVKFIHDALGESIINNMATEATLKELLDAIGGTNSNPSSRGGVRSKNSLSRLPSIFKTFESKAQSLNQGLKKASAPFTGFVSVLAKSDAAMGNFAEGLNDQVIAKLPIFGGLVSGFGSVAVAGIKVLDEWNRQTMRNVPAGATFGNSLVNLIQYSADSRMSLDAFQTLVGDNIERFNRLGPTTDQGIRLFSQFSNALFTSGNRFVSEFRNMGYSFNNINEAALDFLSLTQRGINNTINVNQSTQKEFAGYVRQFDMMSKLMGLSNQEQQERARSLLNNSMFMINMNERGDREAARIIRAAGLMTGFYGKEIAESFMAIAFGQDTAFGAAANLQTVMPGVRDTIYNLITLAQDPDVTEERFTSEMDRFLAESLYNSSGQIDNIQNLIDMMSAGGLDDGMYQSLGGIIETVLDKGIRNKSPAEILEMIQEARRQQTNTETITALLRSFQDLATEFSTGLLRGLVPNLNSLGNVLQQYNIPQLFQSAGEQFGMFVRDGWEKIKEFFGYLQTAEGRDFLIRQGAVFLQQFADVATIKFQRALSRLLEIFLGENVTAVLERLNNGLRAMGIDSGVPFYLGQQEAQDLENLARFRSYAEQGRNSRILDNGGTPQEQVGTPQEGQVIYPDWNQFRGTGDGTDYGGLVYRNGRWQEFGNWTNLGIDWFKDRATDETLIERLNTLAGRQSLVNPNLSRLYFPGGEALTNTKYVAAFQAIIDRMLQEGVPIQGVRSYIPGSTGPFRVGASMEFILPEGFSMYSYLRGRQLNDLWQYMFSNGFLANPNDNETAGQADMAQNAFMSRGFVSGLHPYGTAHSNPNEFRYGTLEETGRLFNDFGRKRRVQLTGDKAVLTREQYNVIKDASAQIPIKDMLAGLNTSVQEMINLTRREIISDREKIAAL